MKKRSIPKMFLLEIVTLGIYRLYWFAKTRRELMEYTKVKIPSVWFLVAPILILVVFISSIIAASAASAVNNAGKYSQCMSDRGYPGSTYADNSISNNDLPGYKDARIVCDKEAAPPVILSVLPGIMVFVMMFTYLPLTAWWYWHYCEAVEVLTNEKVSRILGMLLLLAVPDGIDILILQDYFNKVADAPAAPQAPQGVPA